jgi:beta-phosphoglucomutase-like phosphatase (HAD superfamily)
MELEAIIFDVDGTMAETEEAHRQAFNRTFAERSLDWVWDEKLYRKLLQVTGGKERIRHFLKKHRPEGARPFLENDDLVIDLHKRKTDIYMDLVSTGEVPLRPGVERLILQAKAEGMRLAIATTTNIKPLSALFEGTLGRKAMTWFSAIAAGDVVPHKKPAPHIYRLVLQGLELSGKQCLALEDTEHGVSAARATKTPVVVTVSQYSQGQNFSKALAVLSDLGEEGAPFEAISKPSKANGEADSGIFDLALARKWHELSLQGEG